LEKQIQESEKKGAIIGIGNVLQKDDGIGVKILKYLETTYNFPENIELIDGGTTGAALQTSIMGKHWLLIIDALAVQGMPGDIQMLSGHDFIDMPADVKLSPHQMSFFDLIQFMTFNGTGAEEFSILGVIPEDTGVGTEITPSVDESVGKAAETLISWLNKKGIMPEPASEKAEPDYWWLK